MNRIKRIEKFGSAMIFLSFIAQTSCADTLIDQFSSEINVDSEIQLKSLSVQAICQKWVSDCNWISPAPAGSPGSVCLGYSPYHQESDEKRPAHLLIEPAGPNKMKLSLSHPYKISSSDFDCVVTYAFQAIHKTDGSLIQGSFQTKSAQGSRNQLQNYFSKVDLALDPVLHETTDVEYTETRLIDRGNREWSIVLNSTPLIHSFVSCTLNNNQGISRQVYANLDPVANSQYSVIDTHQDTELVGKIANEGNSPNMFYIGTRAVKNGVVWSNQEGPHVHLWEPDQTAVSCDQLQITEEVLDLNVPADAERAKFYLNAKIRP